MKTEKLLHKELTYKIIGILYKVHTTLGCGFTEKVYQPAIGIELTKENIPYKTEKVFKVYYDNVEIGRFRLDLVVDDKVII